MLFYLCYICVFCIELFRLNYVKVYSCINDLMFYEINMFMMIVMLLMLFNWRFLLVLSLVLECWFIGMTDI